MDKTPLYAGLVVAGALLYSYSGTEKPPESSKKPAIIAAKVSSGFSQFLKFPRNIDYIIKTYPITASFGPFVVIASALGTFKMTRFVYELVKRRQLLAVEYTQMKALEELDAFGDEAVEDLNKIDIEKGEGGEIAKEISGKRNLRDSLNDIITSIKNTLTKFKNLFKRKPKSKYIPVFFSEGKDAYLAYNRENIKILENTKAKYQTKEEETKTKEEVDNIISQTVREQIIANTVLTPFTNPFGGLQNSIYANEIALINRLYNEILNNEGIYVDEIELFLAENNLILTSIDVNILRALGKMISIIYDLYLEVNGGLENLKKKINNLRNNLYRNNVDNSTIRTLEMLSAHYESLLSDIQHLLEFISGLIINYELTDENDEEAHALQKTLSMDVNGLISKGIIDKTTLRAEIVATNADLLLMIIKQQSQITVDESDVEEEALLGNRGPQNYVARQKIETMLKLFIVLFNIYPKAKKPIKL
jgi:hypothetical protein